MNTPAKLLSLTSIIGLALVSMQTDPTVATWKESNTAEAALEVGNVDFTISGNWGGHSPDWESKDPVTFGQHYGWDGDWELDYYRENQVVEPGVAYGLVSRFRSDESSTANLNLTGDNFDVEHSLDEAPAGIRYFLHHGDCTKPTEDVRFDPTSEGIVAHGENLDVHNSGVAVFEEYPPLQKGSTCLVLDVDENYVHTEDFELTLDMDFWGREQTAYVTIVAE